MPLQLLSFLDSVLISSSECLQRLRLPLRQRHWVGAAGFDDELVLQRVNLRHFCLIVGIEELYAHRDEHVFRVAHDGVRAGS